MVNNIGMKIAIDTRCKEKERYIVFTAKSIGIGKGVNLENIIDLNETGETSVAFKI